MSSLFHRFEPNTFRSRLASLLERTLLLAGVASQPTMIGPRPASADVVIGKPGDGGVITVLPSGTSISRQQLQQFVGISGTNSGARGSRSTGW